LDLLRLLRKSGGVKTSYGGVNTTPDVSGGGVNTIESEIINILLGTPGLNAPAIAAVMGKGLRTIQRYIKILSDLGKIKFTGAPKTGGYFLND